ncbi:MAG: glutathione S-transferase family protein [Proteobacteria bacterium]|nr:glutathione S-transferase family protein [Pseudomonadota bacterium]
MKLYQNPVSTTCRPIMMFIADEELEVEQQIVDIMAGEQYGEAFSKLNPNNCVPVLEEGDFRLLESSAILKYLAEKSGSAAYPADPQARARVNSTMDWFNTSFYRTFGYGLVYPQVLDTCKLPDAAAQKLQVSEGKAQAQRFLAVLNDHILGHDGPWLCGETMTIADYFASGMISVGELIGCTYAAYPNIRAWYDRIQARPNWQSANAGVYEWAKFTQGPEYSAV